MSHRVTSVVALIAVTVSVWWGCCALDMGMESEMTMVAAAAHCPTAHLTMTTGHQAAIVSEMFIQPVSIAFLPDGRLADQHDLTSNLLTDRTIPPEPDVGNSILRYQLPALIATVQPRAPSQSTRLG